MKVEHLREPELKFGAGRHIDVRFGLMNYGPVDVASPSAPRSIKLGIVGTSETAEGIQIWLERCQKEVPAKASKQPNLFPRFPGFNTETCFHSTLVTMPRLQRSIPQREFDKIGRKTSPQQVVVDAVEMFLNELRFLAQDTPAEILICAVPMSLLPIMEREDRDPAAEDEPVYNPDENPPDTKLDFHHMLKAKAMDLGKPVQIVLPMTYDETKRRKQKRRPVLNRRLQDEATRAWNFHTALYYKARGTPWRMVRNASELTACYIGITFYKTLDETRLLTSVAQVFNERGDGTVVRGGQARISKSDRQPHLEAQDAAQLLDGALTAYRREHRTLPARVVLHKSSAYSADELSGFLESLGRQSVDTFDIVSLNNSFTRLFRTGAYPPLRGTFLNLDERSHILYTKGSVDFFSTYPGMYVPRPLGIRCEQTDQTPKYLAQEILALSKMNWNATQFDGGAPITMRTARQVGAILKYLDEDVRVEPSYRFYM